jgi:hypothetical protein
VSRTDRLIFDKASTVTAAKQSWRSVKNYSPIGRLCGFWLFQVATRTGLHGYAGQEDKTGRPRHHQSEQKPLKRSHDRTPSVG